LARILTRFTGADHRFIDRSRVSIVTFAVADNWNIDGVKSVGAGAAGREGAPTGNGSSARLPILSLVRQRNGADFRSAHIDATVQVEQTDIVGEGGRAVIFVNGAGSDIDFLFGAFVTIQVVFAGDNGGAFAVSAAAVSGGDDGVGVQDATTAKVEAEILPRDLEGDRVRTDFAATNDTFVNVVQKFLTEGESLRKTADTLLALSGSGQYEDSGQNQFHFYF